MEFSNEEGLEGSPYHGQSLKNDEIRLLTIISTNGSIEIRTKRHSLTSDLEYHAISYVWGTASASISVLCNGEPLSVSPTAHEMLRHLHHSRPEPNRPLWIDAICINQNNPHEKATQIPLMHQIYSRAVLVVVWLGPSIPQTETFMAKFPHVVELAKKQVYMKADNVDDGWPSTNDLFWAGLFHILNDDWFRRLWTFQEVILARKGIVLCGNSWVDLDGLVDFVVKGFFGTGTEFIGFDDTDVPGNPRKSDLAWEECHTIYRYRNIFLDAVRHVKAVNIPLLLNILRARRVKEPVDRVWAISGLLEESFQKQLAPLVDYSDEGRREYWRTLVRFAQTLLNEGQSLGMLCIPPAVEARAPEMPSWCPSLMGKPACLMTLIDYWNYPIGDPGQPSCENLSKEDDKEECRKRVTTIQNHPHKHISTDDDGGLHIRGFVVDTISEVVEDIRLFGVTDYIYDSEWATMSLSNPTHIAALEWHSKSLNLARRVFYGKDEGISDIPQEYLMAFYGDCRITNQAEPAYRHAMSVIQTGDPTHIVSLESDERKCAYECVANWKGLCGHSFFSTRGGRFGLATPGCKPGDNVCVFYGGHPLHILRRPKTEDGCSNFDHGSAAAEFVGITFIPHLMELQQSDTAHLGSDEDFFIK
jgi:Heterokaryon incompatibility protein (HET)